MPAVPAAAAPVTPPVNPQTRAIDYVRPATVLVRVQWYARVDLQPDRPSGILEVTWVTGCTGVLVSSTGHIATAGHCVDSGPEGAQSEAISPAVDVLISKGVITPADRTTLIEAVRTGAIRWQIEGQTAGSPPEMSVRVQLGGGRAALTDEEPRTSAPARVLEYQPHSKGDVALLKIDGTSLPSATLAAEGSVQVGDEVISIGYPLGQVKGEAALTNRNGRINSTDTTGEHGPGNLFYETSAELTPGMSGGPTIDLRGQILGLASFTLKGGQGNFIVPASVVGQMLVRNGVDNKPGRIDELYRKGLDDYYHGYYTDAISGFDQVIALMPQHEEAIAKKREAADWRQRAGDQRRPIPPAPAGRHHSRWLPVTLVVGGAVVLAALTAMLAFVLIRRRRAGIDVIRTDAPVPSTDDPTAQAYPVVAAEGHPATPAPTDLASGQDTHTQPIVPTQQTVPTTVDSGASPQPNWCPSCGRIPDPQARFCSECGTAVAASENTTGSL